MPRLLLDENLSHRLLARLAATFPGSTHVRDAGLVGRSDADLWAHAARAGFVIVTKDDDFQQLSFLHGAPPKVVWLMVRNAGTVAIAALLEHHVTTIESFASSTDEALLVLRPPAAR
jgi:predicted nuclease of predicted toxin-antitoxin system